MGLFKRKDNGPLIPPVAPPPGQQAKADPYAAQYAARAPARDPYASNGSDPYASRGGGGAYGGSNGNPYGRSNPGGNPGGNPYPDSNDAARAELFGGMQGEIPAVKQRKYGYEGRENEDDFDEDEEIEGIKQEMRTTKMDSLASTRNALRLAREAEDTARGTIGRLADQSGVYYC